MLRLVDGVGVTRRELLRIGGLSLGGLSLASMFGANAKGESAAESNDGLTGKSVIFLFQQGGPSQFETFDPKPEAPSGVRTIGGVTPTAIPGVAFGATMRRLAKLADKLTVVRSFQTNNGGHNIQPIVGPDGLDTNIGCYYSRIAGATRPDSGMPTNAVVYPATVADDVGRPQARGDLTSTGALGKSYKPFVPGGDGQLQQDMELRLSRTRFLDDRRQLLSQLDRLKRSVDVAGEVQTADELQQQAYRVLLGGGVSKALDLSQEDPALVSRYDTSQYVATHNWRQVSRGRSGYYTGHAKTIGKLLLLSRRLCEAGCGFVTIHASYAGVWDMHADGNNLNMKDGMDAIGHSTDHAIAAFIEDVESRGLKDKIMLVVCGEMGRTPKINSRGGRDHWARLAPLLIYGGGHPTGRVIGQSTRDGGEPATDNLTPKHLIASILRTTIDLPRLRLQPGVPESITKLSSHAPIPGVGE